MKFFTEDISILVSCKMQIVLYSMITFVLSKGEFVVNKDDAGLTSVPKNINAVATTLLWNKISITRLDNDSLVYLLVLEKLYINRNSIHYIGRVAFEKNIYLYLLEMLGHKLPVFPTHFGGASYRISVLAMSVFAVDMESMQLRNFSKLSILVVNNNTSQTGNLILESIPALI